MSTPDKILTPCPSCGANLAVPLTAAGKKIRCPKCQTVVAITAEILKQPPKNSALLPKVEERLQLKSEVSEEDHQLRARMGIREQKHVSEINRVLQKVERRRKEARFNEALDLLRLMPTEYRADVIAAEIEDLQFFQKRQSGAIKQLNQAETTEQIERALKVADEYRSMLTSSIISDSTFDSAVKNSQQRLDDKRQEQWRAAKKQQKRRKVILIASVFSLCLVAAATLFAVQRQNWLTAIADAQKRGDEALQMTDYAAAIVAYDEVIDLDNRVSEAWLGRAMAKLQQTPPDVPGGLNDLEKGEAFAPEASQISKVRQLAHVQLAIERANADSIPEALTNIAAAEKLSATAEGIRSAEAAVASAYLRLAESAVAAKQLDLAVTYLKEAETKNSSVDEFSKMKQLVANAFLDRAQESLRQNQLESANADIESARQTQSDHPSLPKVQANAFVIRAQQSLVDGNQEAANADFARALTLSTSADGLGTLAVTIAENFVTRCEKDLSEAAVKDAKVALQRMAEIDPSSVTLPEMNDRLSSAVITPYSQKFQQQVAAGDLVACAATLQQLLEFPGVDKEKQRVAVSSLITAFESLCLNGLQSKSPDPAIDALRLMAQTNVTFQESFKVQILTLPPVVIKALPERFLQPGTLPFDAAQAKVFQRAWAARVSLPVELTNSIGMKFVLIPPGEFMMGSPESEQGREPDETQHRVTLTKPFYIGMGEVTQEQGLRVVGTTPSQFKGLQNPVEMLSWDEAVAYCELLTALPEEKAAGHVYRLPTEAEWEYACRGGTETAYNFGGNGKDANFFAWHDGNSGDKTHPVGQGRPNSFGLYDINGNVWEWCADWYSTYPEGAVSDPSGPNSGVDRVCRGGGWDSSLTEFRSASRDSDEPSGRNSSQGFRLVLSFFGTQK